MRRLSYAAILLISVLVFAACSAASSPSTGSSSASDSVDSATVTMPEPVEINTDDDVPRVTPQEAKQLVDSGLAVIVDARAQDAYDAEHIAGALPRPTVPVAQLGEVLDPDQLIITYCT